MLHKSRGIVLKSIRYKEADLITKLFTLEHGVISFHLRGILKSRRNHLKSSFFLPFSILEIDYRYKESKSLQYIKEVKQDIVLSSIHFEISKNAIVCFLAEILNDIVPDKQTDEKLFFFLKNAIQQLDQHKDYTLFTHHFLIALTQFLGCPPNIKDKNLLFFSLQTGCFTPLNTHKEFHIETPEIDIFKQLLGMNFDETLRCQKKIRQHLLHQLIKYYHFHVNGFKKPKSITVLEEVFS